MVNATLTRVRARMFSRGAGGKSTLNRLELSWTQTTRCQDQNDPTAIE
jgi:hypothetical protein